MKLEDLIGLLILGSYASMMLLEALVPARRYPTRFLWRLRGWGFLVLMAVIGTVLPLLMPQDFLVAHRLLDGTRLGTVGGVIVGYVTFSLVAYLWHRAAHRFDFMWRTFHQLHHAPGRMDMGGAAVFHPLETCAFILLSTFVSTMVLGLTPEAAAITGFVAQFYSFFQHLNVRTPQWLGYFIQRPEAHFVHHTRDVHAFNYGDLPIWDLLFGTFKNPKTFGTEEVGFAPAAEARYGAMLACRDVSDAVGVVVRVATRERQPAASARPPAETTA